ncbi:MAG: hypothetical protein AAGI49_17790 [Bacteroidota bacterium]
MKTINLIFAFCCFALLFTACEKSVDNPAEDGDNIAAEVEGVFIGTIVSDATTVVDTYEVVVERLENDRIRISAEDVPAFETTLSLQENPSGAYYQSPWQTLEDYSATYWIDKHEFVMYVAAGNVNFVGDRKR